MCTRLGVLGLLLAVDDAGHGIEAASGDNLVLIVQPGLEPCARAFNERFVTIMRPVFLALSFMHCRNVERVPQTRSTLRRRGARHGLLARRLAITQLTRMPAITDFTMGRFLNRVIVFDSECSNLSFEKRASFLAIGLGAPVKRPPFGTWLNRLDPPLRLWKGHRFYPSLQLWEIDAQESVRSAWLTARAFKW